MNCPHSSVCSAPNVARSAKPRGPAVQRAGDSERRRAPPDRPGRAWTDRPAAFLTETGASRLPSLLTDQAAHDGAESVLRSLPESHGLCPRGRAASEGQPRLVPSDPAAPLLPSLPPRWSLPSWDGGGAASRCRRGSRLLITPGPGGQRRLRGAAGTGAAPSASERGPARPGAPAPPGCPSRKGEPRTARPAAPADFHARSLTHVLLFLLLGRCLTCGRTPALMANSAFPPQPPKRLKPRGTWYFIKQSSEASGSTYRGAPAHLLAPVTLTPRLTLAERGKTHLPGSTHSKELIGDAKNTMTILPFPVF